MYSPLLGRFVGRIQYAPTRDNEKRKTNNEKARYLAKLAGIPDALIFFSHPFLVSRQEKDVGVRGQRPLHLCYMRRTAEIWPFPSSCTRPHRVVCGAYAIRPYPDGRKWGIQQTCIRPFRVVLWGVFNTPLPGTTKNERRTTKKPGTRRKNPATHPAFFTFRLGRYALSLSDVGDRNNIGKHTRCGHVGTGAVALDNHRILVIALGGDHNNVVASLQFVERMGATNLL